MANAFKMPQIYANKFSQMRKIATSSWFLKNDIKIFDE
jgi:hypothetical protein